VLVILRGAMDGLAMLAPYGEPKYPGLRAELALPPPGESGGLFKLDGLFGLHPSMTHIHDMYQQKEAVLLHAVASPYRERSHFDAQNLLENGTTRPGDSRDGWLNRALAHLQAASGKDAAIAMAQTPPLVLRGQNQVASWAPSRLPDADDATLARIKSMYSNDEFFAARLQMALDSQEIAGDMMSGNNRASRKALATEMVKATAKFLTAPEGPRIAVLESGGWDTHANQGAASGNLANRLKDLDASLDNLRREMGAAWSNTVVAVVTEFGRTVKINGTRGTDHGTAGAALLLGGAVNGGRIVADWPGLKASALFEGRDLYPTTDIRSVFKGILAQQWQISTSALDQKVFPDSGSAKPLDDLIRV
jgi:uncharacterized protein (DUF1501 family)